DFAGAKEAGDGDGDQDADDGNHDHDFYECEAFALHVENPPNGFFGPFCSPLTGEAKGESGAKCLGYHPGWMQVADSQGYASVRLCSSEGFGGSRIGVKGG